MCISSGFKPTTYYNFGTGNKKMYLNGKDSKLSSSSITEFCTLRQDDKIVIPQELDEKPKIMIN